MFVLGCKHERIEKELPDGTVIRGVTYNMESYLRTLVSKYKQMVKDVTGSEPNLCKVPTPFLPEDQKEAPARMPITEFPAVVCPSCDHSFPFGKWERTDLVYAAGDAMSTN